MDPYGFTRRMKVARKSSHIPKPVTHFIRKSIKREFKDARFGGVKIHEGMSVQSRNRKILKRLQISNELIWEREHSREQVECNKIMKYIYSLLVLAFFMLNACKSDKTPEMSLSQSIQV